MSCRYASRDGFCRLTAKFADVWGKVIASREDKGTPHSGHGSCLFHRSDG